MDTSAVTIDSTSDDTANAGGQSGDQSGAESSITFSDAQQKHIGKLLSAERKSAAEKARADAKAEADAKSDQERKDKEAADAEKAGDFEKVKSALKADVDKFKSESASLQAQLDQYKTALELGLGAWDKLPDPIRKLGEKQHGEDDVLGRFSFLHDPDTQELVTELAGRSAEAPRGNGPDPRSSGPGTRSVEEEARLINRGGNYAM